MNTDKKNPGTKKIIASVIVVLMFITFFLVTGTFTNKYTNNVLYSRPTNTVIGEITDDAPLMQTFQAEEKLSAVTLLAATYARENAGTLGISITDDSGIEIYRKTFEISEISDNGDLVLDFDTQEDSANRIYTLMIQSSGSSAGNAVSFYGAQPSSNGDELVFANAPAGTILQMELSYDGEPALFIAGRVFFWLCVIALVVLAIFKDWIRADSPFIYIAIGAFAVRILLGELLGVYFMPEAVYDDQLLLNYADLRTHFLAPNYISLVKDMSYPLYLNFVHFTGLDYTQALAFTWMAAAMLSTKTVSMLLRTKAVLPISSPAGKGIWKGRIIRCIPSFIFFYVLFMPCAYEFYLGTRVYRNAIIAPFTFITFSAFLIMIVVFNENRSYLAKALSAVFAGVTFTFFYFIKEDGIWILVCLMAAAIACLFGFRKENLKRSVISILLLLIPFFIYAGARQAYTKINQHYFGVKEINTRTEAAYGEFINHLYAISSDNRDYYCWAPYDAIKKAFEASPTLSQYPELYDKLVEITGGEETPIQGDHIAWHLRTALLLTGLWSETGCNDLFTRVNEELDAAFANGTLEKDDKIQLLASAGGRTFSEILDLSDDMLESYLGGIFLKGYRIEFTSVDEETIAENSKVNDFASDLLRLEYFHDYSMQQEKSEAVIPILQGIKWIYRIINPTLFIIALIGCIRCIVDAFSRKKIKTAFRKRLYILVPAIAAVCFFGISFVYAFGISWFSEFLFIDGIRNYSLNFYNAPLLALLAFYYLFGFICFVRPKSENPAIPTTLTDLQQ